jgi:hypothetical protein
MPTQHCVFKQVTDYTFLLIPPSGLPQDIIKGIFREESKWRHPRSFSSLPFTAVLAHPFSTYFPPPNREANVVT